MTSVYPYRYLNRALELRSQYQDWLISARLQVARFWHGVHAPRSTHGAHVFVMVYTIKFQQLGLGWALGDSKVST